MKTQQNIRLLLAYDGSRFGGWQRVENGKKPSVQATLEQCIEDSLIGAGVTEGICGKCHVTGSGRTDAGVHAWAQTANVLIPSEIWSCRTAGEWRNEWNSSLPEGLRIRQVQEAPADFHSRYDAIGKTYCYLIDEKEVPSVFARKYAYSPAEGMKGGLILDMEAMRKASAYLIGEHDFSAFSSKMEPGRGTVRRIERLEWRWIKHPRAGKLLMMEVSGNGFLFHMVRIIAGTLLEVGMGKRSAESVRLALKSGSRPEAGATLPGYGLTLLEVRYAEPDNR